MAALISALHIHGTVKRLINEAYTAAQGDVFNVENEQARRLAKALAGLKVLAIQAERTDMATIDHTLTSYGDGTTVGVPTRIVLDESSINIAFPDGKELVVSTSPGDNLVQVRFWRSDEDVDPEVDLDFSIGTKPTEETL